MTNEFAAALWGAVIGGFLALVGGVVTTLLTDYRSQVRREQDALRRIERHLTAFYFKYCLGGEGPEYKREHQALLAELEPLAFELTTRRHLEIAVAVHHLIFDDSPRAIESLRDRVREVMNPAQWRAIERYNAENL